MIETWKPLEGCGDYGDCYEVSDLGRIRSITRRIRVKGTDNFRTAPGQILRSRRNRGGYLQVTLSVNKRAKTFLIHRLVCRAFNGAAPRGKPLVLHGDGERLNNRPENLRWGDVTDNNRDTVRHGRSSRHQALKTHCPHGHEYTEDNTYIIPSTGSRSCIICKKENSRQAWIRERERRENNGR